MKNLIIKQFRKETQKEKGKDGVYRTRTRSFTEFTCFHCKQSVEVRTDKYSDNKPCKNCQKRLRGRVNFLNKAKNKFGDKFDLTKAESEYFDATTPVTIKCNVHDYEYKISPTRFTSKPYPNQPAKGGCPKCVQEIQLTKNSKGIDYYLALIEEKFPDISVVKHGTAESNQENITLFCGAHGEFTKTLAKVKQADPASSKLCNKCTQEQHAWRTRMARTDIPGTVYFVKFKDVNLYKCGVTYKTPKERLRGHINNIEILWELQFPTLSDAYFFEYQYFREHHHIRTNHPDNTIGGYTEFFSEFLPKPLQPFIEEILCRKNLKTGKPLTHYGEGNLPC